LVNLNEILLRLFAFFFHSIRHHPSFRSRGFQQVDGFDSGCRCCLYCQSLLRIKDGRHVISALHTEGCLLACLLACLVGWLHTTGVAQSVCLEPCSVKFLAHEHKVYLQLYYSLVLYRACTCTTIIAEPSAAGAATEKCDGHYDSSLVVFEIPSVDHSSITRGVGRVVEECSSTTRRVLEECCRVVDRVLEEWSIEWSIEYSRSGVEWSRSAVEWSVECSRSAVEWSVERSRSGVEWSEEDGSSGRWSARR